MYGGLGGSGIAATCKNAKVCAEYVTCLSIFNVISGSSDIRPQSAWQAGDPLDSLRHLVRLDFPGALARDLASPLPVRLVLKDN